jgi:protein-disulfide isomerase
MDQILDRRRARPAAVVFAFLSLALGACKKPGDEAAPTSQPPEAKPAEPAAPEPKLPGVNVELSGDARASVFKLIEKVPSPCGKPESLRKSLESDTECKRGRFAASFLEILIDSGSSDEEAFERYLLRYAVKPAVIDSSRAIRTGSSDAKVQIVEFFDFGCSHCAETAPQLEKVVAHYGDKVSVAYMDYPLGHWPTSEPAGRAAWAAGKQGKFVEYAHLLFEAQPKQEEPVLKAIAEKVGLDMARFDKDRNSEEAKAQIAWESEQGAKLNLPGRPAVFINGRMVFGPPVFEWMKLWIDEELAVNP